MSARTGSEPTRIGTPVRLSGLYLTPDTTDQAMIQRNQNLLRNALREFLPAPVRTVFSYGIDVRVESILRGEVHGQLFKHL